MPTYQTGTSTSPADLIGKLGTFAQSLGWTVSAQTTTDPADQTVPEAARDTPGRVFSKGDLIFGVGYGTQDVFVCGATAVDGAADWASQTGSSCVSGSGYLPRANDMPGPYVAHHFFGDTSPDYLHVVVERSAGIFNHFAIGQLIKAGTYTGGAYADAVTWFSDIWSGGDPPQYVRRAPEFPGHRLMFDSGGSFYRTEYAGVIRADIDGNTNRWMIHDPNGAIGTRVLGDIRRNAFSFHNFARTPSQFNLLTPLQPIIEIADRPASLFSILGAVPDLRTVNMTLFTPGQLLIIGSDEWLVFPAIQKTAINDESNASTSTDFSSGVYGYAYKRN